jgi:iron(III) transport system permease protein
LPGGSRGWTALAIAVAALVLMPVLVILFSWTSDQTEIWQHLIATQLGTLLSNTLILITGVGCGVVLLGVSLAWLTAMCEFPGRRWFDWALMLPLAMPAYVLAFVALGLLEYAGPVQTTIRELTRGMIAIEEVRGHTLVIVVLTAVLYPYVYMLSRSAFLGQGSDIIEAARSLGAGPRGAFFRIALPMARPAIVAGTSLALMETLADFGAVSIFNYDTFTTAIYKAWFQLFNLQAAAQLASLLLLFVTLALFSERQARGKGRLEQNTRRRQLHRFQLRGWHAWLSTAFCCLVFLLTFVIPLIQLLYWLFASGFEDLDQRFLNLFWHTIVLASLAAVCAVSLALLLSYAKKQHESPVLRFSLFISNLGYALPGTVLAVGVVIPLGYFDQWLQPVLESLGLAPQQILLGSVYALLIAYTVRFLTVAVGPVESAFSRIKPSISEVASSLGANQWRIIYRIYMPMIRPGLLTAGLLVFVDVMKEMPATLLMRPFGWDTLAVRIFEMTSEGEWTRAALPALTLIMVGLLPVIVMIRRSAMQR